MKLFYTCLLACSLSAPSLYGEVMSWSKDALKLQNSLRALQAITAVNTFPKDVPGLEVAITIKVDQVVADLANVQTSLQNELGLMSFEEQTEALDTYAGLMVHVADATDLLLNRLLEIPYTTLALAYNANRVTYYSLSFEYDLPSRIIPKERGGWTQPG